MVANRDRTTSVLGAGSLFDGLAPRLLTALKKEKALKTILGMGGVNANLVAAEKRPSYAVDGIVDVSPPTSAIKNAIGFAGSEALAAANRPNWEHLVYGSVDAVVKAHQASELEDGQGLWLEGMKTGHSQLARLMLGELRKHLPLQFMLGLSTLPEDHDKRQSLRESPNFFVELKDAHLVDAVLLVDNRSPFALAPGRHLKLQDEYLATAIASVLASQFQFGRNQSLAELGRSLGKYAAFGGLAFSSHALLIREPVPLWSVVERFAKAPARGTGDIKNILTAAVAATDDAFKNPQARAIDEDIDFHNQLFVVYTIPVSTTDPAWTTISAEIRAWLARHYPTATPFFASGPGVTDPKHPTPYTLQASVIFPIPDIPRPIQQILASPDRTRRPGTSSGVDGVVTVDQLLHVVAKEVS